MQLGTEKIHVLTNSRLRTDPLVSHVSGVWGRNKASLSPERLTRIHDLLAQWVLAGKKIQTSVGIVGTALGTAEHERN